MRIFLRVLPALMAVNYAIPLGVPGSPYARLAVLGLLVAAVISTYVRPSASDVSGWNPEQVSIVAVLAVFIVIGAALVPFQDQPLGVIGATLNMAVVLAGVTGLLLVVRRNPPLLRDYALGWAAATLLITAASMAERAGGFSIPVADRAEAVAMALENDTAASATFFVNPNDMGVFLVAALPMLLYLLLQSNVWDRIVGASAVVAALLGSALCSARTATISLLVALVLFLIATRAFRSEKKALVLGGLAVMAALALLASPKLLEKFGELDNGFSLESTNSRGQLMVDGFDLMFAQGGLGVGPGGFYAHRADPSLTFRGLWAFNPHNVYIEAIAELGIIAGALLIAWFLWLGWRWLRRSVRRDRVAPILVSGWVVLLVIGVQSSSSLNQLVFWMLPTSLILISTTPFSGADPAERTPMSATAKEGRVSMRDYVAQIRRGWAIILLGAIGGAGLLAFATESRPPSYIGQSLVQVNWTADTATPDLNVGYNPLTDLSKTWAGLGASAEVAGPILVANGVTVQPSALVEAKKYESVAPGPGAVMISFEAGTSEVAGGVTFQVAQKLADIINSSTYFNGKADASAVGPDVGLARAGVPKTLGAIAGFLLGAVVAVIGLSVWVAARRKVMSGSGLQLALGEEVEFLGEVGARSSRLEASTRAAALRLDRFVPASGGRVLCLIRDESAGETETLLAEALVQCGRNVVVVGSESLRPTTEADENVAGAKAQIPVHAASSARSGVAGAQQAGVAEVSAPPSFAQIAGDDFRRQLDGYRTGRDWVIIPVSASQPDRAAAVLHRFADAAVVVAVCGRARVRQVEEMAAQVPDGLALGSVLLRR